MAKAKQGPLLAEIETREQTHRRKNLNSVDQLRAKLSGELLEAFDTAAADRDRYSAEAVCKWLRAHGHTLNAQALRKWRNERA